MKRLLFIGIALILSVSGYAQLIANKTDNKVTMNLDFFNDFQLSTNDNWDARMFNQGFSCALTYNFPLGESTKHTVSLGVGYSGHNYFSYSRIMNPYTTDTLQFQQYRGEDGFKRNKLNCNYIEVPLELRFRIKDAWKIGVGFKFGLLVNAKTKFVGNNEDGVRIHEKYCYISNVERYAYAATLRVGYKWVSAFCAMQLVPVFEVGHDAPRIMPLSVGVTFAPF
ncbi:MAG: outer membrane beta-barrel protein [Bacteroidales bacterium]|nr:outer membrane beta-barrel protein [Bacteroidales bacterium]